MKKLIASLSLSALMLPAVAFADTAVAGQNLMSLITFAGEVLNRLIPLLIALALVIFFWGIVVYVYKKDATEGRKIITAGVIALFVMVSIWGIIKVVQNTLGVYGGGTVEAPSVPRR
jgi:hypothetical protein